MLGFSFYEVQGERFDTRLEAVEYCIQNEIPTREILHKHYEG